MLMATGTYVGNGGTRTVTLPFDPDVLLHHENDFVGGGATGTDLDWTATGLPSVIWPGEGNNPGSVSGVVTLGVGQFSVLQEASRNKNKNNSTYMYVALKNESDIAWGSYTGNQAARTIATALTSQLVAAFCFRGTGNNDKGNWGKIKDAPNLNLAFPHREGGMVPPVDWTTQITALNADGSFNLGIGPEVNTTGETYYYLAFADNPKVTQGEAAIGAAEDKTVDVTIQPHAAFVVTYDPSVPGMLHSGGGVDRIDAVMPNEPNPEWWDRAYFAGGPLEYITAFGPTSFTAKNSGYPMGAAGYLWWFVIGMSVTRAYSYVY